jgi:hypothetical protein
MLRLKGQWVKVKALINGGSQTNLLPRCVLPEEESYDAEHTRALKEYWGNMQSCRKKQYLIKAVNEWNQAKRQLTSFDVTKDQERIALLKLPWLQKINPIINWKNANWTYPLDCHRLWACIMAFGDALSQ